MGVHASVEQEFIKAYNNYGDAIFRFCFFRVFNRERAQEIAQEAFTRTWDYLVNGNHVKNFRAFLYTTARHLIINEVREFKKQQLQVSLEEMGIDELEISLPPLQITHVEIQELLTTIATLDEKYKEPLLLRYIDGFSISEIAAMIGETKNVVSVRIHRAIQELKSIIEP